MNTIDFAVDWPDYEGQVVIIDGGTVVTASTDFAQLTVSGVNIVLKPPWFEREDLRYLPHNCASVGSKEGCQMAVAGLVSKKKFGDGVELTNVNFAIPE